MAIFGSEWFWQSVGWIANCAFLYGAWKLSNKRVRPYAIASFGGNVVYICQGVALRNWSLAALSILLMYLAATTYFRWDKNEGPCEGASKPDNREYERYSSLKKPPS